MLAAARRNWSRFCAYEGRRSSSLSCCAASRRNRFAAACGGVVASAIGRKQVSREAATLVRSPVGQDGSHPRARSTSRRRTVAAGSLRLDGCRCCRRAGKRRRHNSGNDLSLDQQAVALKRHPDAGRSQAGTGAAQTVGPGALPLRRPPESQSRTCRVARRSPRKQATGKTAAGRTVFKKHCLHLPRRTAATWERRIGPDLTGMAVHPKARTADSTSSIPAAAWKATSAFTA